MSGNRARVVVTGLVLSLTMALGGCGKSPEQEYCDQLRGDRAQIGEMLNSADPPAALLASIPMLRGLSDKAPSDLTAQWQVFLNAVVGLRDALRRAGVGPGQFHGGHIPAQVRGQERVDLAAAANVLSSPNVVSSVHDIEQQARDVCKIDLGL